MLVRSDGRVIGDRLVAMVRRRTSARKKRTVYPALGARPARRSGAWLVLVLGALVVVNLYVFVWDKHTGVDAIRKRAEAAPMMALPSAPLAPRAPPTATPTAPTAPVAPRAIAGKVGKADTLGRLLKKSGLSAAEADEVLHALQGVLDFRTLRAGQTYRLERGADGRVARFVLELSKAHRVRAERQPSGELAGKSDEP